ncbi:hypothetical protein DFH07DRAFT_892184 [Mycena maculata]|uniref:Methyltransferase n=1 Tax=Mycena maculata TaxID=230809 RepID=A0AAD7ICM0_9AGAR|nr:hypothetical protein DFH07DRAFT_892184 [Mycena maculata]
MTVATQTPRDVETSLTYWKHVDEPLVEIDFTQPEAEVRYDALDKLDEAHKVTVHDARGSEDKFTLDRNGFTYVKDPIAGLEACTTEEEIQKLVVSATEELVKKVTGAYKTKVFTTRIRNVAQDMGKRADNRAPALSVHSDFTPIGGHHLFEDQIPDAAERETLAAGRVLLINVWRPLKTITRDPLCAADWATIDTARDLVRERFVFPGSKWNELGKWKHSDAHRWYYLSHQAPDEPLVFAQYDSARVQPDGGQLTVPHSAFQDPEYLGGPARQSIEIKMMAFVS